MINKYYIRINFDKNLLKQFLSYIKENTSIKWAGGEPIMYFLDRRIDGIFIKDNKMKYTTNVDFLLTDKINYGCYEEITFDNLVVLNPKNLFYD